MGNLVKATSVRLRGNHLTGPIPAELGNLDNLAELVLDFNDLTGPIPAELANLNSLRELALTFNRLTGPIPPALGNLPNLAGVHLAGNRLTGPIPAELGNLESIAFLVLSSNNLTGAIPPGLGSLTTLRALVLSDNDLTGPIPPQLANLRHIQHLFLSHNDLTGQIPRELGNLGSLITLVLSGNDLAGQIPAELGQLGLLLRLDLRDNGLTGPIPAELGRLGRLNGLQLSGNNLSGSIPPQLGSLVQVETLDLSANALTEAIPPALGALRRLRALDLSSNDLAGPVPGELGDLSALEALNLRQNSRLSGEIPEGWTNLGRLRMLLAGHTDVCAPDEPEVQFWLESVPKRRVSSCQEIAAYLVQTVQSRRFPVPLVAGTDALLRVFPTARRTTDAGIPDVRASFHLDGTETHVVEIPGKSTPIPTAVDEGSLLKSANAQIPGHLVQPGLEMVIEIDPEGTLDPDLGVTRRIPEDGRVALRVEAMRPLEFMLLPFLWSEDPDSAILEVVQEVADSPATHGLLAPTRLLLPVAGVTAEVHEPVWTTTNEVGKLFRETELIRFMERGGALVGLTRYMGMMSGPVEGGTGESRRGGRHGFVVPDANVLVRQVGHLFNLRSAPCEEENPDPHYPYEDGSIGAWGFDPGAGELVSPSTPDLMSGCGPVRWISGLRMA